MVPPKFMNQVILNPCTHYMINAQTRFNLIYKRQTPYFSKSSMWATFNKLNYTLSAYRVLSVKSNSIYSSQKTIFISLIIV
ncbi:hypothetical protein SGA02_11860 [Staphylococcus gallinarum]|uniref:Uncharacterized protein n=1 Tax=Staphylococcus gallinarum TaxID=1293 RepID=A0ABQ0Y1U2_STAGA|nr:hypothetical protein SGA02_11860 [Staphylococcus gallinarum]